MELNNFVSEDGILSDDDAETLRNLDFLYEKSDKIAIKKLSKNDRSWAWEIPESHQAGFYVPTEFQGVFFLSDQELTIRSDKPHILEMKIRMRWLSVGLVPIWMTYKRYTNKGREAHLTVPPKSIFSHVGPASFLVMGRKIDDEGTFFDCLVVDSSSNAYAVIERQFEISPSFLLGVFSPPQKNSIPQGVADELDILVDEFIYSAHNGKLPELIAEYRKIPSGAFITNQAQLKWLSGSASRSFNPFLLANPGDELRYLTADIEFSIYRSYELKFRAAQALEIIFRDGVRPSMEEIVQRVVRNFIPLYQVMLDASQQRKTRVGSGFESHIRKMLCGGNIPHEEQVVVSTRRPDFVMPTKNLYERKSPDALVLAAKTTLRERWKQVTMEQRNCSIFLATMDEKVTVSAVKEMSSLDIFLVVPEAFKARGAVVEYAKEKNVLTFKEFFREEIGQRRRPKWTESGLWVGI